MTFTLQALKKLSFMYFGIAGFILALGVVNLFRRDWLIAGLQIGQSIGFLSIGMCGLLMRRMGIGLKEGALLEAKIQIRREDFENFKLPKGLGIPE